jgi:hypothetical protein
MDEFSHFSSLPSCCLVAMASQQLLLLLLLLLLFIYHYRYYLQCPKSLEPMGILFLVYY